MFPKNSMTITGGSLATLAPTILALLQMFGVGECAADAAAMGCIGATQITAAIVTVGGIVMMVVGNLRARRRDKTTQPGNGQ